jgi:hypothetical protein
MITRDVVNDWKEAAMSAFPQAYVGLGTISQIGLHTDQIHIAISADQHQNNRAGEPLGDSPLAPGDYTVSVRFEVGARRADILDAYDEIEQVYYWSQRQERRHNSIYYHTAITPVTFTDAGDAVVGVWIVVCRVRRARG